MGRKNVEIATLSLQKTVYKVNDFLSWQRSGTLVLSPSFQRRLVWPKAAKSFLIDTVVRGLPVPIVFIRERSNLDSLETKREVVDGQQRLRTLLSFVDPSSLKDFSEEHDAFTVRENQNDVIGGLRFGQLPAAIRARIMNYEFSVHILPSTTEDRQVLQIFARLNSTGIKANHQELRNAQYFGVFKTLMYDLALEQLPRWREWKVFDETSIARMKEVELTSEFAMLISRGLGGRSQKEIDAFYKKHDKKLVIAAELSKRFRLTMDAIADTVGADLPQLSFHRVSLFYALFAYFYDRLFGLKSALKRKKPARLKAGLRARIIKTDELLQNDDLPEDLEKALRGATSEHYTRLARYNFVAKHCGK